MQRSYHACTCSDIYTRPSIVRRYVAHVLNNSVVVFSLYGNTFDLWCIRMYSSSDTSKDVLGRGQGRYEPLSRYRCFYAHSPIINHP